MSRVIEILDSDEDLPQKIDEEININEGFKDIKSSEAVTESEPVTPKTSSNVIEESIKTSDAPVKPATIIQSSPTKVRIRNRRKSVLQTMRASPDMQFETISLDDDDDETQYASNDIPEQQTASVSKNKSSRMQPKILSTKSSTPEELLQAACDEFLATEEVNSTMRKIAEERVRINFLLTSYNMPDISFSLYTQYERLKFQFEDRLKQRKIRNWSMNVTSEQKSKKRQLQQEKS